MTVASTRAEPERSNVRDSRGWLCVAAATFAIAWGGNEFTPLLVMYRTQDTFSAVTVDALLFAYVLGIVPALLIGGPLSDRFGRRPLMLPAPLFGAAGSLVLALGADSAPVLAIGRVLSGVSLGLAMAVGGSWIKELSAPPWGRGDGGARRAAMGLTAGFGAGAGAAGVLAQWAPWPTALAYVVNIVLLLAAGALLVAAPETRERQTDQGPFQGPYPRPWWTDLTIPAAGHRRFLLVVVPVAPWVFGAAASAYAVMPALMSDHARRAPIAFSALLCVVTLGCGFVIQSVGRRIDAPGGVRAVVVALALLVVGMVIASWAARNLSVWWALAAAAVLGCGYGIALVAGLQEVQRIATPADLAGLTAVFYSVSYLGFAVPAVLAVLARTWPDLLTYPVMFAAGAAAAVACLVIVVLGHRAHRPALV